MPAPAWLSIRERGRVRSRPGHPDHIPICVQDSAEESGRKKQPEALDSDKQEVLRGISLGAILRDNQMI